MKKRNLVLAVLAVLGAFFTDLAAQRKCSEFPYEVVTEGWKFPEGPAFDTAGNLYSVAYKKFADIGRVTPGGKTEVFMDLEALGQGAANGMAFSPDGRLFACEYEGRRIISIDLKTREVKTVVDSYEGKPLNEVNDIFLHHSGDIYFTDPYRQDDATTGGRVFVYSQQEKKLYLLVDGLAFPNGLTVSKDKKTLYVAQTVRRSVTAYPLSDNGHKAGPGKEVFLMSGGNGPDGIELDEKGNLFITHYGGGNLYYVSPQGKLLACTSGFGLNLTNVQIHGDWIYVTETERGHIVRIRREHFLSQ